MNNASMKNMLLTALLAVALCALPALAARDTYLLGTGRHGVLTVPEKGKVINEYAQVKAALSPGATEILVDTSTGFEPGDLVLVHQSTGYASDLPPGDGKDLDLNTDGTGALGRWELARLSTTTLTVPGKLKLDSPLIYSYLATGAQVVKVPEHTDANISGELTAAPWNGQKGGILAFLANGTVTIKDEGRIDATGLGFRGGQYVWDGISGRKDCKDISQPASSGGAQRGESIVPSQYGEKATGRGNVGNGGGGGVCSMAGGAGGGNGGRGGSGGKTNSNSDGARSMGGIGGSKVTFDALNRMLFGGGGGAGHGIETATTQGGAGGGIIFIRAKSLEGEGYIQASGNPGSQGNGLSAAHGGGAGGTVYLRISTLANCHVLAQGGRGGNSNLSTAFVGPGGGGGGGRLLLQAKTNRCELKYEGGTAGRTPTTPKNDTPDYGATNGSPGDKKSMPEGDGFPEAMPKPVVLQPANGSSTNNIRPTFTGTLDPSFPAGAYIVLSLQGPSPETYTLSAASNWSFTPSTDLKPGSYTLSAALRQQEVWSEQSNTNAFTIVTSIPAPVITKPGNGNTTSSLPVIEGTAEANSTVTIILNGTPVGSTPSDENGHWTYTPTTPLPDGPYELTATATDAEGNVSPPSNPVHFSVDTRDRAFLGDGVGCAASGGDPSALAMMCLAVLSALRTRGFRR